jgi:PAS domain S-box-containing protein
MMRCLYVDDEIALLEVAKEYLEFEGDIGVEIVSSAKEALRMMSTYSYDAIISDYQMPEIDGISFLKQVREKFENVPFILFTGRGREEVVIEAIKSGADHYIKKGGDAAPQFAELANLIRQAVRRKEAEDAMHISAVRFDALVRNTRDLVAIVDPQWNVIYVSPSARNTLGYNPEDIQGRYIFEYIHPDDRIIENMARSDALKDGPGSSGEFRLRGKDGRYHWFKAGVRGCVDGNENQLILYAWNITDSKALETELVAKDKAYQGLMEYLDEMIFILDEQGRFISANQPMTDFFGLTREQFIGIPATDLATPGTKEKMRSVISSKLDGQHDRSVHDYSVINSKGEEVKISVSSSIITSRGLKRIIGVARPFNEPGER